MFDYHLDASGSCSYSTTHSGRQSEADGHSLHERRVSYSLADATRLRATLGTHTSADFEGLLLDIKWGFVQPTTFES